MTTSEERGVARALIGEMRRLRAKKERLGRKLAKLQIKRQALEDEVARLRRLPPVSPHKDR